MDGNVRVRLSRAVTWRVAVILIMVLALLAGGLSASADAAALRGAVEDTRSDRAKVVDLLTTGGRATKAAAEAALLGSDEQVREFLATGRQVAVAHDNRIKVGQIMSVGGRRVREAAQVALGGTPEDVQKFLDEGWKEPHRLDLRVQVGEIMATGGTATNRAGQAALSGTPEDVLKFLASGQYAPAVRDRRVQVGGIMATSGPEVNKAAQLALEGGDDDVQEFLATGQHTARARDNEQASITELVNLAQQAGADAARETDAAKEASARAVAAAELAKQAALKAADEAVAAKGDAGRAASAAGRAADFASRAAGAAREAIGAANAANNAARVASDAAMRAASAASAAAQAASDARGAAAAAAGDAGQAANARVAAQKARDLAAGARLAADASKAAGEAANQAAGAARAASSAGANADRAASAAETAANQAGVSGAEADRARRAAADAHRFAAQANRAATSAESLAGQAASAAGDAARAANSAAEHAENAAIAADEAAAHAGEAETAARESEKHAQAAHDAANVSTQAAEMADTIEKNAREADRNRLALLQEQGIADAEKVTQDLEHKAAWEAAETTRIGQETQQLLAKATAANADSATVLTYGRQAALRLRDTGGPWTRSAAEMALAGGEPELRDYLDTGREEAAEEDDRARVRHIADSATNAKLKAAAQQAFLGDSDGVREFLRTQYYDAKNIDDRKQVGAIMAKGGPAAQRAGQKALEGTPEDVRQFLALGQYTAATQDDRIKIGEIISIGGPEAQTAGQIALAGPASYARDFVQTGQFKAAQRDSLTTSHVASVRRLVSEAARIAATARENAAEAARVAAVARHAADEAAQWEAKARQSANEAAEYAKQAKQAANDAQTSANRAAESARTARSAANAAAKDAEAASQSAARADSSAAQARASAADAARAAAAARASANAAGRDAALAQEAADDAYQIAKSKQQDEQRAIAGGPLTAQEQADLAATCKGDQACIDKYNKAVADANMSLFDFLKQEGAEVILEMIGYNDAVKCFTQGDVEACIWTAVNALTLANPFALIAKGGKLVAAIAKVAGKVGKFLRRSEEAKNEVKATREAIHQDMKACRLRVIGKSFTPATAVLMANGTRKPIKEVAVGEQVAAADPQTGQTGSRTVAAVIVGTDLKHMVTVTVSDGEQTGSVDATGNHPFWVTEQQQWVDAKDIIPGQHLQTPGSQPAKVIDVRSYTQIIQVYNLTIAGLNTFYVLAGDTPVLVHNAGNDRFTYLNQLGYSNYVLKDANGKIYYTGMFGGKETQTTVEYRHSRNGGRFNPAAGDSMQVVRGTRSYGESRLMEQRLMEEHGTYVGRDGNSYRGNRQNPLAESKRTEYEAYEKRLKQISGGGCP